MSSCEPRHSRLHGEHAGRAMPPSMLRCGYAALTTKISKTTPCTVALMSPVRMIPRKTICLVGQIRCIIEQSPKRKRTWRLRRRDWTTRLRPSVNVMRRLCGCCNCDQGSAIGSGVSYPSPAKAWGGSIANEVSDRGRGCLGAFRGAGSSRVSCRETPETRVRRRLPRRPTRPAFRPATLPAARFARRGRETKEPAARALSHTLS